MQNTYISEGLVPHMNGVWPSFLQITANIQVFIRGIGKGGSKGSDEPPFKPGFILKIANYLSSLNTICFQVHITHSIEQMQLRIDVFTVCWLKSSTTKIIYTYITTHDAKQNCAWSLLWGVNLFARDYILASYMINKSQWWSLLWRV